MSKAMAIYDVLSAPYGSFRNMPESVSPTKTRRQFPREETVTKGLAFMKSIQPRRCAVIHPQKRANRAHASRLAGAPSFVLTA